MAMVPMGCAARKGERGKFPMPHQPLALRAGRSAPDRRGSKPTVSLADSKHWRPTAHHVCRIHGRGGCWHRKLLLGSRRIGGSESKAFERCLQVSGRGGVFGVSRFLGITGFFLGNVMVQDGRHVRTVRALRKGLQSTVLRIAAVNEHATISKLAAPIAQFILAERSFVPRMG